ncbi:DUF5906 domain-containing protein [Alphaproteobacteria bacterium]|nr:DUF5906 domain-containing protein [Alphaproteobacteria bacterium]
MLDRPHTYAALAPRLHAAGYAVLPLDNKAPKVPKWSELAITQQQVAQWATEKPKANIGLRCDQALMVDIDIEVPVEAERMTQLILDQFPGGLIRRRGASSKLALLYRRAELDIVYKSKGQKRYCHAGGGVVELFDNSGAQMGIFSTGLDGGDYHWDGPSPLDVPFNELTPLTLKQWGALRQLLTREGYVAAGGGGAVLHKRTDAPQPATGWNEQVFYRVGALVRQGADTATILKEAEQWREPGYTEAQTQAEVADMVSRWERHIEDNRDTDYEAWRDGWAFDEVGNRYWNLSVMAPILQQAWHTTNRYLRGGYIDKTGKTQKMSYCDRFILDPDAQRVLATTVAPEQPLITDDRYLNLWRDYWARLHADKGQPDGSEAVRLFRALVDFLCDGRDEMIDTLLNWIGYGLFHPAQRLRWSILLISDLKGAGKLLLCTTVARLYGMDNASILPGLVGLLSQFNGSVLEGKALVVVNETVDKGDSSKFGAVETLKSLITDDQISVEHKGRDRRQIDNYARFMFCSNHLDGLPFDENERRFFAIVCQATEALDSEFYARFVEACHSEQGLADIAAWLRDHYSDELPSRPPASDTALVADALVEDFVAVINAHVDTKRMHPIAVRAKDMVDIVDHLTNRRVSATHRVKALKRGGWSVGKIREQRVYWRGEAKPDYIDDDLRRELIDR